MPPVTPAIIDQRSRAAQQYIKPLREGKPELGWSGDPDLVLVYHRLGHWELWRFEPERGKPDNHRLIAKGPARGVLNDETVNRLIQRLVQRDTHRDGVSGEAIFEAVEKANRQHERSLENDGAAAAADVLERVYYEVGKKVGQHY